MNGCKRLGRMLHLVLCMVILTAVLPMTCMHTYAATQACNGDDCLLMSFYADDGTVTNVSDFQEDAVVLIFGREGCGYCKATTRLVADLVESGTSVKAVFLKIDNSEAGWDEFVATYENDMILTDYAPYDNNRLGYAIANTRQINWSYTPLVVVLDKSRKIVDCYDGYDKARLLKAVEGITTNKYVEATGIKIDGWSPRMQQGDTLQLSVTVTPEAASARKVTWRVGSDTTGGDNAEIVRVDNNGLVSAVGVGTALVIAQIDSVYDYCWITVTPGRVVPTDIKLNANAQNMTVGESVQLTATVEPGDAYDTTVTWHSSDTNVASVDTTGLVKCHAAGNVTITAKTVNELTAQCEITVTVDANEENPFADVKSSGSWEYPFVKYVYENNYMAGKGKISSGKIMFDPDAALTRAEFVQVLYNLEGKPAVAYTAKFSDVPEGKWFTNAVTWAEQNGIVAGKGEVFDTDGPATREQLAIMFWHYADYKGYASQAGKEGDRDINSFADVSQVSSWAKNGLNWALSNKVMSGKGTNLDPLGNARRSECAAMIKNFKTAFEAE